MSRKIFFANKKRSARQGPNAFHYPAMPFLNRDDFDFRVDLVFNHILNRHQSSRQA
jgi:hypothetical protein